MTQPTNELDALKRTILKLQSAIQVACMQRDEQTERADKAQQRCAELEAALAEATGEDEGGVLIDGGDSEDVEDDLSE